MLNAIGLTLDLVGAALLLLGLFRTPKTVFSDWIRTPLETTHDRAYGITSFLLLGVGFMFQALPSFGVRALPWLGVTDTTSGYCARVAAAVTLGVGVVAAWLLFQVLARLMYERQWRANHNAARMFPYALRFNPGLRADGRWRAPALWRLAARPGADESTDS